MATRDAIDTLRAAQVIIVGGPAAVSPEVAAKLAMPGP
jgi:putative cell wall-binding protein